MTHRLFLGPGGHGVIDRVIFSSGSLPSLKERVPQKENSNEKKSKKEKDRFSANPVSKILLSCHFSPLTVLIPGLCNKKRNNC